MKCGLRAECFARAAFWRRRWDGRRSGRLVRRGRFGGNGSRAIRRRRANPFCAAAGRRRWGSGGSRTIRRRSGPGCVSGNRAPLAWRPAKPMKRAFAKQNPQKRFSPEMIPGCQRMSELTSNTVAGTHWPTDMELVKNRMAVMIPATTRPTDNATRSVLISRF